MKHDQRRPGPELFFALVGALGSDLTRLSAELASLLLGYDYSAKVIRLSALLDALPPWQGKLAKHPADEYITQHQDKGNELRELVNAGNALAILGIAEIRDFRRLTGKLDEPLPRQAYIIRSLKHPEELRSLRQIYGPSLFVIAAYSPIEARRRSLAQQIATSKQCARDEDFISGAQELIQRDESEGKVLGQRVGDTFPLADVFVHTERPDRMRIELSRFLELLFAHPFRTPNKDEFAMFHAQGAALRSADLSRQVGAAIATAEGDVIALGTNDVPKSGGGLYWPGDDGDARDFQIGRRESLTLRQTILGEVIAKLERNGWLDAKRCQSAGDIEGAISEILPTMTGTTVMGIMEFGRTVHAEMSALMDAAARAVAVRGATLYPLVA